MRLDYSKMPRSSPSGGEILPGRVGYMASGCISSCRDARPPVRATYVNLYKWPESDAEFVKSVSRSGGGCGRSPQPQVVDSYWCRQVYLRSYTFSRKESMRTRTRRCVERARERVAPRTTKRNEGGRQRRKSPKAKERCAAVLGKGRELTCAAMATMFQRLLSCTTGIDVVDR